MLLSLIAVNVATAGFRSFQANQALLQMQAIRKAAFESSVFACAGVRELSFRIGMYQLNLRLLVGMHLDNEASDEQKTMVESLKSLGKGLRKTMVSATRSVCEGSSAGAAKLKGLVNDQSKVAAERAASFKKQVIEALLKVFMIGAVSQALSALRKGSTLLKDVIDKVGMVKDHADNLKGMVELVAKLLAPDGTWADKSRALINLVVEVSKILVATLTDSKVLQAIGKVVAKATGVLAVVVALYDTAVNIMGAFNDAVSPFWFRPVHMNRLPKTNNYE